MSKLDKLRKPLVSVIMPVHNAQAYLRRAISSILQQTYRNFEFIIVDDASTDDSWDIIRGFKGQFSRKITAVRLNSQAGAGGDKAANLAYSLAKGELVARMDADDIAHPQRLAKQVTYLMAHPQVAVVGSCAEVIDKHGKRVGEKQVQLTHEDIYQAFFVLHPMIHPTVMLRRSKLISGAHLYRIAYDANNDYLTFFELLSKGRRFANLPEKLLQYRIHGKNDSLVSMKQRFLNTVKIRWYAVRKFGYVPSVGGIFKLVAQTLLVLVLPQAMIMPIYLLMRGIYSPKELMTNFIERWQNGWGRLRLRFEFVGRSV